MKFQELVKKDYIKLYPKNTEVRLNILYLIEGDFYGVVSPTLLISGYGKDITEAKESFKLNLELFIESILEQPEYTRLQYIQSLRFNKEKYNNERYSSSKFIEYPIYQDTRIINNSSFKFAY